MSRKAVLEEAHERDRLAKEFLNQGEVNVVFPDLGMQTSRFSILNPTMDAEVPGNENEVLKKPPIVMVPGLSNELDSIEGIAQTIAHSGRKVISIGYPEGYVGKVTEEFANAVVASGDRSYHAQFFKEAIKALTQNEQEIELWGLSTGSPIVAELLSDPKLQDKVTQAVLIGPAASVDQSVGSINIGLLKDLRSFVHSFSDIVPSFVLFRGKRGGQNQVQKALGRKIMLSLQKTISHKSPHWNTMRVKEGGKITVIAGGKDDVTKSYKALDELRENPQVQASLLPNETHITSFNSQAVQNRIKELQNAS